LLYLAKKRFITEGVAEAGLALTAFAQLRPVAFAKNLQTGNGLFAIFQSICTRQSNIKKARHKGELF
jgi:hypothetical protein